MNTPKAGVYPGLENIRLEKKTNWCFSYLTSKYSEPISLAATPLLPATVETLMIRLEL